MCSILHHLFPAMCECFLSVSLSPEEYAQVLAAMRRAGFADPGSFVYWAVMQRLDEVLHVRVEVV